MTTTTALLTGNCSSNHEAEDLFENEKGLLLLRPTQTCYKMWFTIPSGCYALVTCNGDKMDYVDEHGVQTPVWPAGLHIPSSPCTKIECLVTKKPIIFDFSIDDCRTKDDVMVKIDFVITFRIMGDILLGEDPGLVRTFVNEVTPSELKSRLQSSLREQICKIVGGLLHSQIYGIHFQVENGSSHNDSILDQDYLKDTTQEAHFKKGLTSKRLCQEMKEQFNSIGVDINSVSIKQVNLPDKIQKKMTGQTLVRTKLAHEAMHEEYLSRKTRWKEEIESIRQTNHEEGEHERQISREKINQERIKLNKVIAENERCDANIKEMARTTLESRLAQHAADVQHLRENLMKMTEETRLDIIKKTTQEVVDAKFEAQSEIVNAIRASEEKNMEANEILTEAEGKIAEWSRETNKFEIKMKQLKVCETLADNKYLDLCSDDKDVESFITITTAILCDEVYDEFKQSTLIAELAIMGKRLRQKHESCNPESKESE